MKKIFFVVACAGFVTVNVAAQRGGGEPAAPAPSGPNYPAWAYAITPPPPPGSPRPCPPAAAKSRGFTIAQIVDLRGPADWFPEDHPVMPSIVAVGRQPQIRSCSYCHYPNGKGRS